MRLLLNKAHFPVTVLGPGRRIGIWFQGCSIGCPGCLSRDTWDRDPNTEIEIGDLLAWCRSHGSGAVDGVTISGGEPFEQPEALAALVAGLDEWRLEGGRPLDMLCYSGLPLSTLRRKHSDVLAQLDAIIPGPYRAGSEGPLLWRGSVNQTIEPLSRLGVERYGSTPETPGQPHLQVAVDEEAIWYIGLPRRGDLDRLERALAEAGVEQQRPSWRA